jgi:hypothetical protein
VIWRFRLIVAAGFVLALALGFLSYASVSFKHGKPTLTYRQFETWKATNTIFMTQGGFPWGRTVLPYVPNSGPSGGYAVTNYADMGRLASLAVYYAELANSDPVQALLRRRVHVPGAILAAPIVDPIYHYPEPFVTISGLGHNPKDAITLANAGATSLLTYIKHQQEDAGIPVQQRITPQVISAASGALLTAGRRKTAPIVIFLTVLLASIGLAFILENLRPRVQLVGRVPEDADVRPASAQRSA